VHLVDEDVSGDDRAAVRARDDGGVVTGTEDDARRRTQALTDAGDEPELPRIRNRDVANSPRPIPSRCRLPRQTVVRATVSRVQGAAVTVQAYILIQTEVGKAAAVATEIASIKGVTMAEDVTGPYDVIVRAEARNVDELGKLVVAKVQGVPGITRTLTCPVVHL
jgi:DNA-binding Lrp family transcriptional regulator